MLKRKCVEIWLPPLSIGRTGHTCHTLPLVKTKSSDTVKGVRWPAKLTPSKRKSI